MFANHFACYYYCCNNNYYKLTFKKLKLVLALKIACHKKLEYYNNFTLKQTVDALQVLYIYNL